MSAILHIAEAADWQRAAEAGSYRAPSLESEGFIHCSTPEQVIAVAERFYHGRRGLVLLVIDPARLASPLRWAPAPEGGPFPHVYGPVNMEAVSRAIAFEPRGDGRFDLPADLA
jgi:uncharacterized protein (DUF952 family)